MHEMIKSATMRRQSKNQRDADVEISARIAETICGHTGEYHDDNRPVGNAVIEEHRKRILKLVKNIVVLI